ncbi:peptide deformylase [Candidatus Falkowbacteria bacterium RIFOXYB2_FULL_34_18]|uniref:Peptide deformylase n=1 Tax=Candidatus Falkowbacteria bacterium RIFOXYD2_FULL_34_120 TaxID=1798007 RepID=A0A1F5TQP4_9BACT|nr:MAG: peptide deformylase [Candidatus Falkowbacteria bacterium RIFOXYB2_FULL_34_18]OGF29384.1 MAG: peptide deformylase [Candidatus Falkowbacteria bacterium RIFOXYC12_FULL_34_55]OGF36593.1 MAG: peptide deformylase [Candidatus Falkowbacteria bacterium RIFOXYC2_FULL_34_220]OGF38811.1 MAG: peptide deformylase [Candidatus Falkowbacteria bacterium RIFOXYD12_FULL_34_57]OGF41084.1 MAG: peptide deformylase [Candidatus Falkowbacteria bacterium RIFOXYD2_FULL_34_120]
MLLKIITNPNSILRKKSKEVKISDIKTKKFQTFCHDLIETMKKKDGVGLAAPQIGKNIRVFVIHNDNLDMIILNPEIIKKSWSKEWGEEGCLSVPNTFGKVRRHKKIKCRFIDKNGKKQTLDMSGMPARIFQHELDHLDGILFIDSAKNIKTV